MCLVINSLYTFNLLLSKTVYFQLADKIQCTFCILLAPRNKGYGRGRNRRGQNNGRYPSQEHWRQQRDFSDRRDGFNQPQRRGTVADRRPPSRRTFQASVDSRKVLLSIDLF